MALVAPSSRGTLSMSLLRAEARQPRKSSQTPMLMAPVAGVYGHMLRPQANLDEFSSTYWQNRKQVHRRLLTIRHRGAGKRTWGLVGDTGASRNDVSLEPIDARHTSPRDDWHEQLDLSYASVTSLLPTGCGSVGLGLFPVPAGYLSA